MGGSRDWAAIRLAYISDVPRPTFSALGERFGTSHVAVLRVASEENWAQLREEKQTESLKAADVANILGKSLKEVHAAPGMLGEVAIALFSELIQALKEVPKSIPNLRARIDALNTCSFALKNSADALEKAGVFGLAEIMKKNAEEIGGVNGHGKWDKSLLSQINITVQNMTAEKKVSIVMPEKPIDIVG